MKEWFTKNWIWVVVGIIALAAIIAIVICFVKYPHFRDYCTSGFIGLLVGFIGGYITAVKVKMKKLNTKS